jgi:hypothetical protein
VNAVDRSRGILAFWLVNSRRIWKYKLVTFTSEEFSFTAFNAGGGVHEKHAVAILSPTGLTTIFYGLINYYWLSRAQ